MTCPPLTTFGPPPRLFFSAARAANGCSPSSSTLGGANCGAGLARIGIDAEHQELGRDGAEIDDAVDQRLRRLVVARRACGRLRAQRSRPPAWREVRSTASSISFSIGSSVTTQVCPTRALDLAGDMDAARRCRVRSNAAASRGKSRRPASSATLAHALRPAPRSPDAGRSPGCPPRPPARSRRCRFCLIAIQALRSSSRDRRVRESARAPAARRLGCPAPRGHGPPPAYRPQAAAAQPRPGRPP